MYALISISTNIYLDAYYVPDNTLDTRHVLVNRIDTICFLWSLESDEGGSCLIASIELLACMCESQL